LELQGINKARILLLPIASFAKAATTAESTPPERPKIIPLAFAFLNWALSQRMIYLCILII